MTNYGAGKGIFDSRICGIYAFESWGCMRILLSSLTVQLTLNYVFEVLIGLAHHLTIGTRKASDTRARLGCHGYDVFVR